MNPRWPVALLWLCILAWVLFAGGWIVVNVAQWLIALAAQWIGAIGMAVFGS